MANFATPFSSTGPRRNPTSDERANGFPCGPADQTLFNGLFYRLEAELGDLIAFAGLTPTDADFSQVRKSIVALIESATGGGETESYLLIDQAISRLPIFPEVLSADGKINITSPASGTVRVPGGVNILHRGISIATTVETDLATSSSKTYHLRWNPVDGFSLKDLGNSGYNPDTLAETDQAFDSSYDDMLLARVVTNSSNVAAITTLSNKARLMASESVEGNGVVVTGPSTSGLDDSQYTGSVTLNWARTPRTSLNGWAGISGGGGSVPFVSGWANRPMSETITRYGVTAVFLTDYGAAIPGGYAIIGGMKALAVA